MRFLRFGDIVLVPFPFTNQTASKKRPAVIVSGEAYNRATSDIVLMAISSQLRTHPLPGEAALLDWRVAGLLKPSVVKPVLSTLEQGLILRQLGTLTSADQSRLRKAIAEILAWPSG